MTRALIIGSDGPIGRALALALLERGDEVMGTSRRANPLGTWKAFPLDLAMAEAGHWPPPLCDVTVICAAMARFADCREKPELARQVNVTVPLAIARRITEGGGRVILLSTSAVLGGDAPFAPADGLRRPTSAYGRLKAEAEEEILALGEQATVLRLTKVIRADMALFNEWIRALKAGQDLRVFEDLTFSPLTMSDVIEALLTLIDGGSGGIFQISGSGDLSYADAARYFARRLGAACARVKSDLAIDHGIPSGEVPRFTSLDCTRLAALSKWTPPPVTHVLDDAFGWAWNSTCELRPAATGTGRSSVL